MRREFLPAGLACVTDLVTGAMVRVNQPDYPGRFVVFQMAMLGAALLVAVPGIWVRLAALVIMLAGFFISGVSVGWFYLPTVLASVWIMVRGGWRR